MRPNKLRQLLQQGAPTLGTRIYSPWPTAIEVVAHAGVFDYVEFLAEYAPFTLHDLDNMARAAEVHGLGLMIKVDQENSAYVAQRAIGAGFGSVLFTDCRSVEDAERYIRSVRPDTPGDQGRYGVAARRSAHLGYASSAEYVDSLREVVVALMIEKGAAVESLEEILAVPGLDMVQWGPSDYSMSIGRAGERRHPDIAAAERRVFEAALRRGIPPRAEIGSPDDAKRFLDMGVRHFSLSDDISILNRFYQSGGEQLRKALEG